jgi:hypothetical protein
MQHERNKSILLFLHHIKSAKVVFDMMSVELVEKEREIGQVVKGAFVRPGTPRGIMLLLQHEWQRALAVESRHYSSTSLGSY